MARIYPLLVNTRQLNRSMYPFLTSCFISRIPFYGWFRLTFLLYLILPQTQGARYLYEEYLRPWLQENENAIDELISSAHERGKAAGLEYLNQGIELVRTKALGLPPSEPSPPQTPSTFSYAQSLISRFAIPSARAGFPSYAAPGAAGTGTDFYSLLASAVSAATPGSSHDRDLAYGGGLIPSTVRGDERITFIEAQRERLRILLSALDREETAIQHGDPRTSSERSRSGVSGLSKSRSETDFEKIDAESGEEGEVHRRHDHRDSSGSWMPWGWGNRPADEYDSDDHMGRDSHTRGRSSGIDR